MWGFPPYSVALRICMIEDIDIRLFKHYHQLSAPIVERFRSGLCLDPDKFKIDMMAPGTIAQINAQIHNGQQVGVRRTRPFSFMSEDGPCQECKIAHQMEKDTNHEGRGDAGPGSRRCTIHSC
jgi:hypothetical protein